MAVNDQATQDGAELEETEALFVTLTDDDGEEETFQLVQTVEVEGKQYGVLVSADADMDEETEEAEDEEDEGDILILRVTEENGEEYFEEIEDDAEFQKVVKHLESIAA
jgi:uncharacterized protein YrzB (UPF0473 family)